MDNETKVPVTLHEMYMMLILGFVAGLAGVAHLIYGSRANEVLTKRHLVARFLVSAFTALMIYPVALSIWSGAASGYFAVAIAAAAGSYTDLILRGSQTYIKGWLAEKNKQPPGPGG
jgi:hypothetical protein